MMYRRISMLFLFAGGFSLADEPFALRLGLAQERLLMTTRSIAQPACSAYVLASSVNPAADDFLRTGPGEYDSYGQLIGNHLSFEGNGSLYASAGSGSFRFQEGTFTGSIMNLQTNRITTQQGLDFDLSGILALLRYSRTVGEGKAWGAEVLLSQGDLDQDLSSAIGVSTDLWSAGVRLGWMQAVGDTLTIGLHAMGKVEESSSDVEGLGFHQHLEETMWYGEGRLGVTWRPVEFFGTFFDLQYLSVADSEDTIDAWRLYAGAEMFFSENIALRGGTTLQQGQSPTWSAGVGCYHFDPVFIELGYSYNHLPEVREEFGRGHLFSVSATHTF